MVEVREGRGEVTSAPSPTSTNLHQPPPTSTILHKVLAHSTVTLFARLRGRSTSHPRNTAMW